MIDFTMLIQTVGLPWAVAFTVAVVSGRVIVVMWRDANARTERQIMDLKEQVAELREDRDYHRDRLYDLMGVANTAVETTRHLAGERRRAGERER